mmetsp:Transcript_22146/g.10540  ORF Transcript_22146/g.10540 Transcript_22146/m.10540 type:complete len:332 (+) Transcript_22146:5740-6735(+)
MARDDFLGKTGAYIYPLLSNRIDYFKAYTDRTLASDTNLLVDGSIKETEAAITEVLDTNEFNIDFALFHVTEVLVQYLSGESGSQYTDLNYYEGEYTVEIFSTPDEGVYGKVTIASIIERPYASISLQIGDTINISSTGERFCIRGQVAPLIVGEDEAQTTAPNYLTGFTNTNTLDLILYNRADLNGMSLAIYNLTFHFHFAEKVEDLKDDVVDWEKGLCCYTYTNDEISIDESSDSFVHFYEAFYFKGRPFKKISDFTRLCGKDVNFIIWKETTEIIMDYNFVEKTGVPYIIGLAGEGGFVIRDNLIPLSTTTGLQSLSIDAHVALTDRV